MAKPYLNSTHYHSAPTSIAYRNIAAEMVDMESYACLRVCMRFDVPLVVLRGISDGKSELYHVDDWTEYLHVIDEKLASAVDRLGEALAEGLLAR
ncbi:phosphorylase family protein [Billgrantia sp. Q4P2]|uniref:phosphorylase family protein n=1 Tax=Billgrantia sp. Q4P2 TaxID=3463857 RepID=UPI0040572C49